MTRPRPLQILMIACLIGSLFLAWSLFQEWRDRPRFANMFSLSRLGTSRLQEELQLCLSTCDEDDQRLARQGLSLNKKLSAYSSTISEFESELISLLNDSIRRYQDSNDVHFLAHILIESLQLSAVLPAETPEQILFRQHILYSLQNLPRNYPNSADAFWALGVFNTVSGEDQQSIIEAYRKCLQINPNHPECQKHLDRVERLQSTPEATHKD